MVAVITLNHPIPGLMRVGQTLAVSGRVRPAAIGAEVALEYRAPAGALPNNWTPVAEATAGPGGRFSLRWQLTKASAPAILDVRLAAIRHHRTIASTAPTMLAIGPAAVPCAAPVPPAVDIPFGDGWIEGGAIIQGGPFPGVYECVSEPYTVTATNTATGQVAATMTVPGGDSYTLVVPAGSYTLTTTGGCPARGSATVTAAVGTTASAYCDVP
jgi:hypothetical protein